MMNWLTKKLGGTSSQSQDSGIRDFYESRARDRAATLDVTDSKQVFDQVTELKMSGSPDAACEVARTYLEECKGQLPRTALGLWIGVNAGRCAIQIGDRALASQLYAQLSAMEDLELRETELIELTDEHISGYEQFPAKMAQLQAKRAAGETHHEVFMASGWDDRTRGALQELRAYRS